MYVLNIFKNLTKINDVLFVYFCGRLHERINNIPGGVPIKVDQKFSFSNFGLSISVLNPNFETRVLSPQIYGLEHEF